MYDPKTGDTKLIRTCFNTHHLVFAEDANNTLWTSAGGPQQGAIGWLNRKVYEETGDEAKAQGWTPVIIDTNGNGKRDDYVQPNQAGRSDQGQAGDRGLLRRRREPGRRNGLGRGARLSGLIVLIRFDPEDQAGGSLRAAVPGLRAARLRHRPQRRRLCAAVERPSRRLRPPQVQGPAQRPAGRGRQAVSGRLDADPFPGPQFRNVAESGSAEASYYTWVDQHNTSASATTCRSQPATPTSR